MKPFINPDLMPAYPEISLIIITLMLLMAGVAGKANSCKFISLYSVIALLAVGYSLFRFPRLDFQAFEGMFVADGFAVFMKMLVVGGAAVSILMSGKYLERERINRFEYPILILFSTIGMMLMISANDLMALYVGLELQSLPLYVLAAIQRDTVRSTEAGLKYFVLGALSSGMLLYGMSLIYGYTGATGFNTIAAVLAGDNPAPLAIVTGMVLMTAGLAFKISAVPFHMWAPDVYEGAPTSVTAFFAIVPKVAAVALITRVFMGPFGNMVDEWRQVLIALSVASMFLGAIAAIAQTNIKRMLAYSSISHMGYALVGLVAANAAGIEAIVIYMSIYMVMSIGAFAVVLLMKQQERMVENISDLSGLAKKHPMLALSMAILMFSMAGIPPLAGFFGKLFIFQAAVQAKLFKLAVIGVLASVVSAYYYLRIIKIMYFDEALDEGLDELKDKSINVVLMVSVAALVAFIMVPTPLLRSAESAAASLWH